MPALVMMWYAGMEGGHALAHVLTGEHNPTGRLPFAFPTSEAHLPSFDRDATVVTYDRFHGQRLLDRIGVAAAFPHGFGLSYTTFAIPVATCRRGGGGRGAVDRAGDQHRREGRWPRRPGVRADPDRALRRRVDADGIRSRVRGGRVRQCRHP